MSSKKDNRKMMDMLERMGMIKKVDEPESEIQNRQPDTAPAALWDESAPSAVATAAPPAETARANDVNTRTPQPAPSYRRSYEPPAYATPDSVGIDLRACLSEAEATIPPGSRLAVPSGLAVEPASADMAGFVYSRSGLGAVQGLTVAQGTGVIDPDYRGEIIVILLNTSPESRTIRRGDRIAQLVFQPVFRVRLEETTELNSTGRGAGGFGHTGA